MCSSLSTCTALVLDRDYDLVQVRVGHGDGGQLGRGGHDRNGVSLLKYEGNVVERMSDKSPFNFSNKGFD
jgi:hypothetical protein